MKNNHGFNTRLKDILTKIMLNVMAEEGEPTPEPTPNPTPETKPVNFEDLIAKARKQEKDKLYPQIQKLEGEVATLTEKSNAHLLTIGEKEEEIADLKKQIKDFTANSTNNTSEREKALQQEVESLQTKIKDFETNTCSREEIEAEIKAEYDIKFYREQKLREVGDEAITELIVGSTVEEIDKSVEIAKERYQQITNKILGGVTIPVANTNTSNFQQKELKLEDIANLDPRSPEYAQLRAKLGLR